MSSVASSSSTSVPSPVHSPAVATDNHWHHSSSHYSYNSSYPSSYSPIKSPRRITAIPTASGEFSVQSLINCSSSSLSNSASLSSSSSSGRPRLGSTQSGSFVKLGLNRLSFIKGGRSASDSARIPTIQTTTDSHKQSQSTSNLGRPHSTISSSSSSLSLFSKRNSHSISTTDSPVFKGDYSRVGRMSMISSSSESVRSSSLKVSPPAKPPHCAGPSSNSPSPLSSTILATAEPDTESLFSAQSHQRENSPMDSSAQEQKHPQLSQLQTDTSLMSEVAAKHTDNNAPIRTMQRGRRDSSLSPITHQTSSGESEIPTHMSSPASSMIFERSVQEFYPSSMMDSADRNCYTYHNEDYIPPVLDATTNAITDDNVDPDTIGVSVPNSRLKSISSFSQLYRHSGTTASFTGQTTPPRSPVGERKASVVSDVAPSTHSQQQVPKKMLSFYSFADLCNAESLPVSPMSPEDHQLSPSDSLVAEEMRPVTTVRTLSETLGLNTGELGHC